MNDREYETQLIKRYAELAERAARSGAYTYTSFHSAESAALAYQAAPENEIKLWGGTESSERMVVRFGDPEILGEEDFPIRVLHIEPTQPKFADSLSHRDFLGAILNLGIERDTTGDILVKDNGAYVFVLEDMADYISASLERVKHTSVKCSIVSEVPKECLPKLSEERVTAASLRLDAIIAKVYHLSRQDAKDLFNAEKVSVNGRICKNPETVPGDGSKISVRGYGKMEYAGEEGISKKGKPVAVIRRYI